MMSEYQKKQNKNICLAHNLISIRLCKHLMSKYQYDFVFFRVGRSQQRKSSVHIEKLMQTLQLLKLATISDEPSTFSLMIQESRFTCIHPDYTESSFQCAFPFTECVMFVRLFGAFIQPTFHFIYCTHVCILRSPSNWRNNIHN